MLVGAAKGWFLSDRRNRNEGVRLAFYDEHGLDQQRAYWIVCLMVGSDPDKFKDLADETKLPEERQGTCQGDYSNASWSWDMALKPHRRSANQPKTKIDVVYGEGKGNLDVHARSARSLGLLEVVANHSADEFVWRAPFTLELQTCGSPNSGWNLSAHKVTLCYEMADDFARLYRDYSGASMAVGTFVPTRIVLGVAAVALAAGLAGFCAGYFRRRQSRRIAPSPQHT